MNWVAKADTAPVKMREGAAEHRRSAVLTGAGALAVGARWPVGALPTVGSVCRVKWLSGAKAETWLFVVAVLLLAVGAGLALLDQGRTADIVWAAVTVLGVGPGLYWVVAAARRRQLGVDIIAVLAQLGALAVGEYLAGAIITVMLASGRMLEARAGARAERDLRALVGRAPRTVQRYGDAGLAEAPAEEVQPGDLLLIRPGEVLAVDGMVESGTAVLDESALTGEPLPVEHATADAGAQRHRERRGRIRPPGEHLRCGEHLCGRRPSRRAGAGGKRAVRPNGRPVRRMVPAGQPGPRRCLVGAQWRSGASCGGARGGDSVPVDPRCAGGDRVRPVARRPGRRDHQGRRCARAARQGDRAVVGQDRDLDRGASGRGGGDLVGSGARRRAAAAGGIARPGLPARARRRDRAGGSLARLGPRPAD